MKNFTLVFALLLCSASLFAQYQVGVPVYDTIYVGQYHRVENCTPDEDVNIGLDQPLLNYVSGLELWLKITEVNIPQGSLRTNAGPLTVDDSLSLSVDQSFYPFFFDGEGDFKFIILAKGTPEVEHEIYPCELSGHISLIVCQSGYVIVPDEFS